MKSRSGIIDDWKKESFDRATSQNNQQLATALNSQTSGVINYYGKYYMCKVEKLLQDLNYRLQNW